MTIYIVLTEGNKTMNKNIWNYGENSAVSVNVVKNDVNAITATHNRLAARRKCINELTALKR